MSKKGICSICKNFRWLSAGTCRPCGYSFDICINCNTRRKIQVNGLCYMCYQDRQSRKSLQEIEHNFQAASDYNKYVFELYLTYIRRYHLQYFHKKQAEKLCKILEESNIQKLLRWEQVYRLSQKHKLFQYKKSGCAFLKIGYMLQELGVLPPRYEVLTPQIDKLICSFDQGSQGLIKDYLNMLKFTNRADSTRIDHLFSLKKYFTWIKGKNLNLTLLTSNESTIRTYLIFLYETRNLKYIGKAHGHIKCFYRFCKFKRLILVDPAKDIKTSKESEKLCVCSEEQVDKLFNYIKSPNSNPEYAMLISLVLIWGLKNEDLVHAKLTGKANALSISLRQKKLTKGKRFYNREQNLLLPLKPVWFYNLQIKFYNNWRLSYAKTKKNFPHYSLFLPYSLVNNRPLSHETINKRVLFATKAATGISIPIKILRQTCGFIHSRNQDASILSTLGWSQKFSFNYTWLPITYFTERK